MSKEIVPSFVFSKNAKALWNGVYRIHGVAAEGLRSLRIYSLNRELYSLLQLKLYSRRNLRSMIEKRGLSINQEFLSSSLLAQQALDQVEEEVNFLAECCDKQGDFYSL